MLLSLGHTGKGGSDEIAFEGLEIFGGLNWRVARGGSKGVDEFEDEEARKCAAQVRNAVNGFSIIPLDFRTWGEEQAKGV